MDPAEIWKARKAEAEAWIEEAQELEIAAEDPQTSIPEATVHFAHASNLRLRALCLLDPTTRAVAPEGEEGT